MTTAERTERYGYRAIVEYDLRPGGAYRSLADERMKRYGSSDVVVEGKVVETEAPRKLVQTWRMLVIPAHDGLLPGVAFGPPRHPPTVNSRAYSVRSRRRSSSRR